MRKRIKNLNPCKLTSSLVVSIPLFILSACGRHDTSKLASESPQKPLIVVMGGYASCGATAKHGDWETPLGMGLYKPMQNMLNAVTESLHIEFDILLSCFTKPIELRSLSSDDDYNHIERSAGTDEFIETVRQKISEHSQTFLIGHSYGGWLGMQALAGFEGRSDRVKGIHTVDPISRKRCRFENPGNWGYCNEAPSDIDTEQRQHIADYSEQWVNTWEDKTPIVHSSVIEQADRNTRLQVLHWDLDTDESVWDSQRQDIIAALR